MGKELRKSGIDIVGNISWGSRLCLFYQDAQELLEILVPFVRAGLINNELCLWVTSEPLGEKAARQALKKSLPNLDKYLEKGQLEIIPYTEWYVKDGALDLRKTARAWDNRLNQALDKGYEGVRATFNMTWLDKRHWQNFMEFEKVDARYDEKKLTICAYSLDNCGAPEIIDVVSGHQFALIKRNGKWDTIERREHNKIEHTLNKRVRELRCLYDIASITGTPDVTLNERFSEIVEILPRVFQYPEISFARIQLNGEEFKTGNYRENDLKMSADIIVRGDVAGTVEVGYSKPLPSTTNVIFSKEERLLLDAVAERLGSITAHRQAEEALRESEEKFSRAFRSSPAIVAITTLEDGRFIEVNDSFTHYTGYSREEALGLTTIDTGSWLNDEDRSRMVKTIKKQGRIRNMEVVSRTKSGEIRTGLLSAELINIGSEPCIISATVDITEQKQSQEILQSVSHSSPLGIYIVQDDKLQYTNPQFQKITGYSQQELLGRELLSLVAVEDYDVVKSSTVFTLREASPYPCEYRILSKTGQIKWVLQTVSPIHYEHREAILGNLMDITERKYLERKVIEYEELSKMKGNLLATVSHELRTPLATIKGYSTMVIDYHSRLPAGEILENIKAVDHAADRLAKLVDNLLDTSRMDAGLLKLSKSPTSVSQLIQGVATEAYVRANHHNIVTIFANRLPRVNVDAKRIRQVLDNLIDNAIKYAPPDTEITIAAQKSGLELLVSVSDQGPGIPAEELTNVFDRMYRIEQRLYSGADGIGLGLYICQRLVDAHGGRIWAESTMGKGTTIKFTLPITGRASKMKRANRSAG
jgi:PAS domain S-box-containing protein